MKIITTMDPQWQEYAQQAAEAPYAVGLPSNGTAHPDTSIVSVDPSNGAIRTMVSGKDFQEDDLDLAATPHPTGSAFKPFVLAAAFEQGVPPTQTYSSASPFCSPLWQDDRPLRVQRRRRQRRRQGRSVDRDRRLDQRRVRPTDLGHRPRNRASGRVEDGRHRRPSAGRVARDGFCRGVAARHGRRLRDPRQRRRPLHALHRPDDHPRRQDAVRTRAQLRTGPASGHRAPDHRDARTGAEVRHRGERLLRTGGAPGRSPARPAPPTSTKPSGSAATRPSWPPRCGSGSNGNPYSLGERLRWHGGRSDLARVHVQRDVGSAGRSPSQMRPTTESATVPDVVGFTVGRRDRGAPGGWVPGHRSWTSTPPSRQAPSSRRYLEAERRPTSASRSGWTSARVREPDGGVPGVVGLRSAAATRRPGRRRLRGARADRARERPHGERRRALAITERRARRRHPVRS